MKYTLLQFVVRFFHALPLSISHRIGTGLGLLLWFCAPKRRRLAIAAIVTHLEFSPDKAKAVARQSFIENMRSFLEIFQVAQFSTATHIHHIHRPDILHKMQQETHPIIIPTAHIGSWEFMAALSSEYFSARQSMVVVRSYKDKALNKLMFDLRGAKGLHVIGHRNASGIVLNKLRENGLLGILVDHNCSRKEAVFLPFLNDIAAVNSGPALLALRAKAGIYPAFLLRSPEGKYTLHMSEPLYCENLTGTIAERTKFIAQHYTDAVAEVVKKYPEQWFWMHNRWKTREDAS